ncbi:imidazole glycerol phosphate synthase subunit HisH [Flammeovirga aprica]|uniref:Imidazole glycerol phosphate synthase subunit HisH n=1 Tax=Flammeovirga aprica JL-4 TaxID=694437 RepID=A0A7X9RS61_9BACT|nr:imidazole glycerol phosphate synthase subunit HisH [Flammeovirga aprica]NME66870.1 imidazole glycerol phosphate synthase subunit HisH [Flammeovirga aprica JL-4]
MKVAILKYNAGNVQSVRYALQRLGIDPILTDNAEELKSADKVIFPGVGEAKSAMDYLKARQLDQLIKDLKQPTLGVCLGLQLMCKHSEERNTDCLGIFDVNVKKFESETLKVPHMGWNNIHDLKTPLYEGISNEDYVYYVHSYYAELCENTIAVTDYVNPYSASLHKDNFYAAQFHPEKSGDVGQKIIENFLTKI